MPFADGNGLALSVSATRRDSPGLSDGPQYAAVTITDHRTGRAWNMDPLPAGGSMANFSPDGSRLILQTRTGGVPGHGDVSVWDVRTGRRLMSWPVPAGITGLRETVPDLVALSADTRGLLSGDSAGQLTLVEIATGKERASFRHGSGVLSCAVHPDGSKAVSSSPDAPVYVWDLMGDPGRWDPAKADAVWADLASPDAKVAFAAIRKLRANPTDAVAFLKERVALTAVPSEEQLARLLAGLDARAFADRERAQRELVAVADLVRPRLEAARKTASEEAGRRLDQVLKAAEAMTPRNCGRCGRARRSKGSGR